MGWDKVYGWGARGGTNRWRDHGDSGKCLGSGEWGLEVEGGSRPSYSVMSTSIPPSISSGSSPSVRQAPFLGKGEGEATTLDELATPMSGHKSPEGDEIAIGGEKPKGGRTGGESSSLLLSLPFPFRSLVYLSSGV